MSINRYFQANTLPQGQIMQDRFSFAKQVLSLIDLTSLNSTDTDNSIIQLAATAKNDLGQVAALCVYPQFIETALDSLHSHGIKGVNVATVVNFPAGKSSPSVVQCETEKSLIFGAHEIDLVFPYIEFMKGNHAFAQDIILATKEACKVNTKLKVIIESGVLNSEKLIRSASELCIDLGADFIKTSTGKVPVNATYEAASYMLTTIKESGKDVGFKAAGGIQTLHQASEYMSLAQNIMGDTWLDKKNFRFGASSLLNSITDEFTLREVRAVNEGAY